VRRNSEYALHYTTEPGRSYVIEPKEGEIDYKLAYKNPNAFYKKVLNQEITEHKIYSPKRGSPLKLETTLTKRKLGIVLFAVIEKMSELI
jgi:hypothetical protein